MTDNSEILIKKDPAVKPASKALTRFENILEVSDAGKSFEQEFQSAKRTGQIILLAVFGVFGLWATLMPIDSAVHAPGQVTVKSYKKPVQHLEGGIVKEVLVHDGDKVKTGDALIQMDDTQAKSQLSVMTTQLIARLALAARLTAERDGLATVSYPPELKAEDPDARAEISAQNQIFKTRKANIIGQAAVLQERVGQLQSRLDGLQEMLKSKSKLAASYQEEMKDFQALLAEGFADKLRLRDLERNYASTSGDAADMTSTIASTRLQIGETKLQIQQLQISQQAEIAAQLSDAQTQIKDLRDRITGLADTVSRAVVRAQDDGVIYNLKVHIPGAVIPPGAIVAEIVPESDELVIEAKVLPTDIDLVVAGLQASVRLPAFNSRTIPILKGKVISVSPDIIVEPNGASFYLTRVEMTPQSMKDLQGLALVPGMPAEVMIATGTRTLVQYLLKPLTESLARSVRETE